MTQAIGILELTSIARGMELGDVMLKSANVQLLLCRTLCPGKFLLMLGGKCYMVVAGDIADVDNAVTVASDSAGEKGLLVYRAVIPRPHDALWQQLMEG